MRDINIKLKASWDTNLYNPRVFVLGIDIGWEAMPGFRKFLGFESKDEELIEKASLYDSDPIEFNGLVFTSSYARYSTFRRPSLDSIFDKGIYESLCLHQIPVLYLQRIANDFDDQDPIKFQQFLNQHFDSVYTLRSILTRVKPDPNDKLGLLTGGYRQSPPKLFSAEEHPVLKWKREVENTPRIKLEFG